MKNLSTKTFPILLALLAAITGYALAHPLLFGFCANTYQFNSYTGCSDSSIGTIGTPLFLFSQWALFVGVTVFFTSHAIFKYWLKFAAWFLPLAFIFIALTPVSATRLGIDFYPYYRINAAHDAGVAFLLLSLLFIAWKWFRTRRMYP